MLVGLYFLQEALGEKLFLASSSSWWPSVVLGLCSISLWSVFALSSVHLPQNFLCLSPMRIPMITCRVHSPPKQKRSSSKDPYYNHSFCRIRKYSQVPKMRRLWGHHSAHYTISASCIIPTFLQQSLLCGRSAPS